MLPGVRYLLIIRIVHALQRESDSPAVLSRGAAGRQIAGLPLHKALSSRGVRMIGWPCQGSAPWQDVG